MPKYKAISREIFAIFRRRGHPSRAFPLDEAFIDLGEVAFESAREFAAAIRSEVLAETALT